MLSVGSSTTTLPAHVCQIMSEILSEGAVLNLSLLLPTRATPTLAAVVHWPGKWVTSAFALVLQIYSGIRTESVSRSVS